MAVPYSATLAPVSANSGPSFVEGDNDVQRQRAPAMNALLRGASITVAAERAGNTPSHFPEANQKRLTASGANQESPYQRHDS